MDKILPDGGYAPEEDTPFNLYKDAGKHGDVNERIKLAERRVKMVGKKDDDVFMEKIGPGIEIPVPGLTKSGRLEKTSAVTMDWFNRMSQGITDNLNRIDMVINRFDADDMFHEIEDSFVPDFEAAARALGKIADGFDSGKY